VNWLTTVHHGLPASVCPFNPRGGDYLAFLGRIAPEKRPDRAIEIAKRAGVPLRIAAKVDPVDREYFEETIEPLLDHPLIEFIGEIDESEKRDFLGHAMALLFPIDWPEPFGLVMIEAMACGTPVIAFRRGSVPEVIDDGVTGFVVEDEAEAIRALKRLGELDRRRVRARFEERFTSRRMAQDYIEHYEKMSLRSPQRRDISVLGNASIGQQSAFNASDALGDLYGGFGLSPGVGPHGEKDSKDRRLDQA
jgi:glycosyltransferase involved in cell wall biosynthesis